MSRSSTGRWQGFQRNKADAKPQPSFAIGRRRDFLKKWADSLTSKAMHMKGGFSNAKR
jgi:hypothetical protein